MIKHNCCKECKFEWTSVDPFERTSDKLQCNVCGRTFEEIKLINNIQLQC